MENSDAFIHRTHSAQRFGDAFWEQKKLSINCADETPSGMLFMIRCTDEHWGGKHVAYGWYQEVAEDEDTVLKTPEGDVAAPASHSGGWLYKDGSPFLFWDKLEEACRAGEVNESFIDDMETYAVDADADFAEGYPTNDELRRMIVQSRIATDDDVSSTLSDGVL